jgi:signal transduction histidine kinase
MYLIAVPLYGISYLLQMYLVRGDTMGLEILRETFGTFAALSLHFVSVELVLIFYRQYVRLNHTLVELDASKKELEKAYAVVADVSALEERQRIAKEIHDTAGHSLTTVIMQTEAAKRIIDTNPTEAKNKLIAANLQAKNTLDRLRESVHVLSGEIGSITLKTAMESIIHESTDGTGIKIRAKIEDIYASEAKHRFLCNTLKEGISNGLRHGNATAFWFELKIEEGKIRFYLSDNGTGLATDNFESGFGLTTKRDRVRKFGGDMYIMSEPDEGFELNVVLPIGETKDKTGGDKKNGIQ